MELTKGFIDGVHAEHRKRFLYYQPHAKQQLFHKLGSVCRERLFLAGNRVGKCVGYHTLIDLWNGGKIKAGHIFKGGKPVSVVSWDGERCVEGKVTYAVIKPAEPLVRLHFRNGRYLDCASNHIVLLRDGRYCFVQSLISCGAILLLSTLEHGQSARGEDDGSLFEIPLSCQDGYSIYSHQYGGQPHSAQEADRAVSPSQDDVLKHSSVLFGLDDYNPKCIYTRQLSFDRLSNRDVVGHYAGQSFECEDQGVCTNAPHTMLNNQVVLPPSIVVASELQSILLTTQCPILYPFNDGNEIIGYNKIPAQPIFDITVDVYENYIAEGVVHHNTFCGATEMAMHLTGVYPSWWEGKRFNEPVDAWAASDTGETTRDILQNEYLGNPSKGTVGAIHTSLIVNTTARRGVSDAVDTVYVQHKSGGVSQLGFKSYDQGRSKFQGTHKHFIHLDEEPPQDVYDECFMRTAGVGAKERGQIMQTMTPLGGLTPLLHYYTEGLVSGEPVDGRVFVQAGWEDNTYLSKEEREDLAKRFASRPHELEARMLGIPSIGSGMIYPIEESKIICEPFEIPNHFRRCAGMDFGWSNPTAVVWLAHDTQADIVYAYAEYAQSELPPQTHAFNIQSKGAWIPIACDPAGQAGGQADGEALMQKYQQHGLKLVKADNSVETGIQEVFERMLTGRLKIFNTCQGLLSERRSYARDEKGRVKKMNDHRLDALRYGIVSGLGLAITERARTSIAMASRGTSII